MKLTNNFERSDTLIKLTASDDGQLTCIPKNLGGNINEKYSLPKVYPLT